MKNISNNPVTQQMFPDILDVHDTLNAHNNAADAFRHAYWSALNTMSIGGELAYSFGVAHEAWVGNPITEKAMDLTNNYFGINAAIQNPSWSKTQMVNYIYNAVANGQLLMIRDDKLVPTNIP